MTDNMTLTEKKRKLSAILGINLFDAKYKDVDEVLQELGTNNIEDSTAEEQQEASNDSEGATNAEEKRASEILGEEDESAEEDAEETSQDDEPAEEEEETPEDDKDEDDQADKDGGEESTSEETTEEDQEEAEGEADTDELFDAKLEARLLRAGVREDRLDAARKLFKADHSIDDIELVDKFINQYPEWTRQQTKQQPQGFGMTLGEDKGETPEEKRLRELGIK